MFLNLSFMLESRIPRTIILFWGVLTQKIQGNIVHSCWEWRGWAVFCPNRTRGVVALCVAYPIQAFSIGENLGNFGVSCGASSPSRSQRKTSLANGTRLDLRLLHGITRSIVQCNPWAKRYFLAFCVEK